MRYDAKVLPNTTGAVGVTLLGYWLPVLGIVLLVAGLALVIWSLWRIKG